MKTVPFIISLPSVVLLLLVLLVFVGFGSASEYCNDLTDQIIDNEDESVKTFSSDNSSRHTANSQLSSVSLDEVSKFSNYDESHTRPRGSSIHSNTGSSKKDLHVSIGWLQFSDDQEIPSENMEDTPANRDHLLKLMLADARHGNLEYFRYLVGIMQTLEMRSGTNEFRTASYELDLYNEKSLVFAAVQSDNAQLFQYVMELKGVTFSDLMPFKPTSPNGKFPNFSPGSYPPKGKSILDDEDEDEFRSVDSDEERPNIEETVFGYAIIRNSIEIVKLLIDKGVRDNFPERSETALHLAIHHHRDFIVKLLLERGESQIDKVDGSLRTPLMVAIAGKSVKIVKYLIRNGASLVIEDFNRQNILHYAAASGDIDILTVLKDSFDKALSYDHQQALINSPDWKKNTPLHYAADETVFNFIRDEMGADPEVINYLGEYPKYHHKNKKINT